MRLTCSLPNKPVMFVLSLCFSYLVFNPISLVCLDSIGIFGLFTFLENVGVLRCFLLRHVGCTTTRPVIGFEGSDLNHFRMRRMTLLGDQRNIWRKPCFIVQSCHLRTCFDPCSCLGSIALNTLRGYKGHAGTLCKTLCSFISTTYYIH